MSAVRHRGSLVAGILLIVGCATPAPPELTYDSSDTASDTSTTGDDTTTTALPTTDPTTTTTTSDATTDDGPVCGNGIVEEDEFCDDGNAVNSDDCLDDCTPATCGDGYVQDGVEDCDDENMNPHDACLNDCTFNVCGDGIINDGVEICDDSNSLNTDGCLNDCTPWSCGDGFVNEDKESCDDGINSGLYGSCSSDCSTAMPACGDGIIDEDWGENCDGNIDLENVICDPVTCRLDFVNVNQLFCRGFCTWDIEYGCGQADADIFCRLLMQNPDSVATSFDIGPSLEEPGFACADPDNTQIKDMQGVDPRVNIGPLPEYGVELDPLFYQSGSIAETHGAAPNDVILNPVCTNP